MAERLASPRVPVLLVEDTRSLAELYLAYLHDQPYDIVVAGNVAGALDALRTTPPAAVLLDLRLPDGDGMDLLRVLRRDHPQVGVVVMTAHGSVSTAVEAMRLGAQDFLVKPFSQERLLVTLANAVERVRLTRAVAQLHAAQDRPAFAGFIGNAPAMQAVYRILENAAASRAPLFLTGESGTGKHLAAEAVHRLSARRAGPLVTVECGTADGTLAEAMRGADGGTLFLDEVGDLPLAEQAILLPLLQAGRIGGRGPALDVRIVSATHRDPMEEVRAGRLREDLFYRLNVIPVALPPLRDRGTDVIAIAQHFLERSAAEEGKNFDRLAPDAQALLQRHSWPGNVRELQNAIRMAIVLHDGPAITASMLPVALHNAAVPAGRRAADGTERIRPLAVVERDAIEEAIALCGGNVARAAAFLGLAPSTLYRKRQSWDAGVSRTG